MNSRWLACVLALFALIVFGPGCKGEDGVSFIEILLTSPEARQTEVPVETRIGFRMNAPIDEASLTNQTFFLTDEQGALIPSTVSIGVDPDTAELRPDEPLPVITTFVVTVTTGLLSTEGATLEEDFEWSFTTLDSAWGDDEWLEEIGTGSSSVPEIAVDAQLNALAVWQYEETSGNGIFANHYDRTDLWGEPIQIDDGNGGAANPKLAVDDSGNGFAVWEREADDGSTSNIWTNRYDVDDGWGTPELLQNGQVTSARSPSIAADPAGNAIAVWVQRNIETGQQVIWANRYEPDTGWGSAGPIDDMPAALAGTGTAVDMDDDGNGIAIWARPTQGVLWANRYAAGSGWGTAELIKSDSETGAAGPRLDVGPDGDAFVVWVQTQETRDDIWGIRFSGASWEEAPVRLDRYEDGSKQSPDIAVDGTGVAHAVWSQADVDFENIWATQYTPGSGWGAAELIEPPNDDPRRDGDATRPRIGVNAAGNAFVVWRQETPGSWISIWSNRLDPGAGWMTAETIEQSEQSAGSPRIAVDDARHAHAVWPHSRGELGGDWLRTNRFE